jgi:hypothetical protein
MLKILSSEHQLYAPQEHFFQGAYGKIFRPLGTLPTMASADFSSCLPWPCSLGSPIVRHNWRSPRVRRNPFPRFPPDLPPSHPSGYRASLSIVRLPCDRRPCIRFLFVGSEICLRLPPDLASRQRPCLQLTVPTTTACSGLSPYRITPCLAHKKELTGWAANSLTQNCFLEVVQGRLDRPRLLYPIAIAEREHPGKADIEPGPV